MPGKEYYAHTAVREDGTTDPDVSKWQKLGNRENLVAIDVETTGMYPLRGDRVIEIAAVRIVGSEIDKEFSSLINCGKAISKQAAKVNGIDSIMLVDQPDSETVFQEFKRFVGNSLVISHNAKFERSFIRHEFGRLGWGLTNKFECSLKLSRKLLPKLPSYSLGSVSRHLFGELPSDIRLHRAIDDARLTARVWVELMKRKGDTQ